MTARKNIDWSAVADLGKAPDRVVAERLGVSQNTVRYARVRRGLEPAPREPTPRESLADRFARRVVVPADERACHLWTGGAKLNGGYGSIGVGGRMARAHRVAWELANGPVPPGMCVCHRCDVPACVNVAHLFLGTHAENAADRNAKGRQAKGDGHPSRTRPEALARGDRSGSRVHPEARPRGSAHRHAKLTEESVVEIRARVAAGEPGSAVARRFSVGPSAVRDIAARRTWRHVA